jgi:nucleotide-binding universal stress UspA family protein
VPQWLQIDKGREITMFKHILVATDGSAHSDKAIALALRVADGRPDTRVSALLVVRDYGLADYARATFGSPPDAPELRDTLADEGHQRLAQVLTRYGERAARIVPLVTVSDRPFEDIVATATRERCDLIVMAPRGRGAVAGALLGSQTQRVLSLSKVPVLVAP